MKGVYFFWIIIIGFVSCHYDQESYLIFEKENTVIFCQNNTKTNITIDGIIHLIELDKGNLKIIINDNIVAANSHSKRLIYNDVLYLRNSTVVKTDATLRYTFFGTMFGALYVMLEENYIKCYNCAMFFHIFRRQMDETEISICELLKLIP